MRLGPSSLVLVLALASGCATSAKETPSGDAASSSSASPTEPESPLPSEFDPLSIEEPPKPEPHGGKPSLAELTVALRHLPKAYTYSMRTGFGQVLLDAAPDSSDAPFSTEFQEMFDDGLHAEMEPASLRILATTGEVERLNEYYWGAGFRVEMTIPRKRLLDRDGELVRTVPAQTLRAELGVVAAAEEYFLLWWRPMDQKAA